MLPGLYPTGKCLEVDAISLMSAHGGTVECYCLMQIIRGAEACTPPVGADAHNVLRQYRQQASISVKAVPDSPGLDGETPVRRMLGVLQAIVSGQQPDMRAVHQLHELIVSGDINSDRNIQEIITQDNDLDSDVGMNLIQLLGGSNDFYGTKRRRSSCTSAASEDSVLSGRLKSAMVSDSLTRLSDASLDEEDSSGELSLPNICTAPIPEVEAVLRTADHWHFDAFKLTEASQGYPLSTLGFWLIQQSRVAKEFKLEPSKLAKFLRRVEDGYNDTPYHSKAHAADVLQSMHTLLTLGGLASRMGDELIMLAGYLSAICHDLDHKGLNNDFLIKTSNPLAIQYNDLSPLENHHLAQSFRLLNRDDCGLFRHLPKDRQVRLRKLMIEMVLGTDMKQHVAIISRFQTTLQVKLHSRMMTTAGCSSAASAESLAVKFEDPSDRCMLLQMALKCADLGHLAAPWPVHQRWVGGLEEELFRQGDNEKQLQMPVSPLMDRFKGGITKSQVGFFDVVAMPLFRSWCAVLTDARPMLRAVEDNRRKWKAYEQSHK
ncbi:putative 3',5'-cyclic phosphodiesterase pde-3 [Trebouxia sp. C0009 RCD-2024]